METNSLNTGNETPINAPISNDNHRISEKAIQSLRETRPWISFMGIVGFVMCGFLILFSFFMIIVSSNLPSYAHGNGLPGAISFVIYLIAAVVSFFPALYLYNYGQKLKDYLAIGSQESLEQAMDMQKRYYQFIGILSIIYLAFLAIFILIALFAILTFSFR